MRVTLYLCCLMILICSGCAQQKLPASTQPEHEDWELSKKFAITIKDNKGSPITRTVIGKENRVVFTYTENVSNFVVNKPKKYLWYFWGEADELNGTVKFSAIEQQTKEEIELFKSKLRTQKSPAGNAVLPSTLNFPSAGIWKINIYIGEKLFDNIIVKVTG
ncbi:hypothetical protein AB4124_21160 [Paenibacillus sp. 2KB_20]|uniref:hypothetical protein n=1 Tax=Paenibacillus sp. 2KB_20 TaxID=3232977 RepID=UPI003F9B2010